MFDLMFGILEYYTSFLKVFVLRKIPSNKLDLLHWSSYQIFNLYDKPLDPTNAKGKDLFLDNWQLDWEKVPLKRIYFNRWMFIVQSLLTPFVCILLGIFVDKIYFVCIKNPDYLFTYGNSPKTIKNCLQYKYFAHSPISGVWYRYMYHITHDIDLCVSNKHCLNQFCQKYSIPTIKCYLNMQQINQAKAECSSIQFLIKQSEGKNGKNMFLTTNPEIYLGQIPTVVIQPKLYNHVSIVNITGNKNTLNTFRICTFSKDTHLNPETTFRAQYDTNQIADNLCDGNVEVLMYNFKTKTLNKRVPGAGPLRIASQNPKDVISVQIEGLDNFIAYLENIHHKHFNIIIGIGWDVAKLSNGEWVVVEWNQSGYYYSNTKYSDIILESYLNKMNETSSLF